MKSSRTPGCSAANVSSRPGRTNGAAVAEAADDEPPAQLAALALHVRTHVLGVREQLLGLRQEAPAGGGQGEAARAPAHEQLRAERVLQPGDGERDGRLRHEQLLRRRRHRPRLDRADEALDLAQVQHRVMSIAHAEPERHAVYVEVATDETRTS